MTPDKQYHRDILVGEEGGQLGTTLGRGFGVGGFPSYWLRSAFAAILLVTGGLGDAVFCGGVDEDCPGCAGTEGLGGMWGLEITAGLRATGGLPFFSGDMSCRVSAPCISHLEAPPPPCLAVVLCCKSSSSVSREYIVSTGPWTSDLPKGRAAALQLLSCCGPFRDTCCLLPSGAFVDLWL